MTVLNDIAAERVRQAAQWGGHHAHGAGDCSSPHVAWSVKVAVLLEEAGEVARAFLEQDAAAARTELIQLAAVAAAIAEGIDAQ